MVSETISGIRNAFLCCLLISLLCTNLAYSQQLPVGYISYYSQRGNTSGFIETLAMNHPGNFEISKDRTSTLLKPFRNDSAGIELPPASKGIIADIIFGEFIIEFDYKLQSGIIPSNSGFYFLCPVKSDNTYYALAFSSDSLSFFYANNGSVTNRKQVPDLKVNTGWNNVRIERNILSRSLSITLNGDDIHKAIFTDPNLVMGYIGFGTHNLSSYLKNVNIWAPTAFTDTLYVP